MLNEWGSSVHGWILEVRLRVEQVLHAAGVDLVVHKLLEPHVFAVNLNHLLAEAACRHCPLASRELNPDTGAADMSEDIFVGVNASLLFGLVQDVSNAEHALLVFSVNPRDINHAVVHHREGVEDHSSAS